MALYLHQIWFDLGNGAKVPIKYLPYIESWKNFHQNWTYKLWDENSCDKFLSDHYSWFIPYYNSYQSIIHKIDSIRYFLLYHYGGAYIDIDIECKKPLDNLMHENKKIDLFFFESGAGLLNNATMLSRNAKDKFFVDYCFPQLIKNHQAWWHMKTSWMTVIWMSGPMFLRKCVSLYKKDNKMMNVMIFSQSYFPSGDVSAKREQDQSLTYGYHHFAKSWSNKKRLFFDAVRISVLTLVAIFIVVLIVAIKSTKAIC